ncbi:MAG: selenide, water dikinase SelD [Candidatus Ventricola sp.]
METEVKLTKLASCAGCGAKLGAGTLAQMLEGFKAHEDPRLIVGYDKSDDASVYVLDEHTALIQTTDFFPPIVDDPFLYGRIAAVNAMSDVYAMGGEPKLALNILCAAEGMPEEAIREILRGGYDAAYEAGAIITGGHTIRGAEPLYGLAVSGFVHPQKVLTNSRAMPGDVLILTKPLGVGILTTAAKADMADAAVLRRIYAQMAALNKAARDIMVKYPVHSCTDVTGFSLLGHGFEMAQGSGCTLHIAVEDVPFHREALEFASMGLVPAGAYRNRQYAEGGVKLCRDIPLAMQDILYDPQTSGGLLFALPQEAAQACLRELLGSIPQAAIIGHVTNKEEAFLCLE